MTTNKKSNFLRKKIFYCILISSLFHFNAFALDEINLNGEIIYYKGGQDVFCKDYEAIIIMESNRIQGKSPYASPRGPSNDEISSTFRIMGLSERVGGEKIGKIIEKCVSR